MYARPHFLLEHTHSHFLLGVHATKGLHFEDVTREYYRGKYHCTIDLLFHWFGVVCFENKDKNCQLSYS